MKRVHKANLILCSAGHELIDKVFPDEDWIEITRENLRLCLTVLHEMLEEDLGKIDFVAAMQTFVLASNYERFYRRWENEPGIDNDPRREARAHLVYAAGRNSLRYRYFCWEYPSDDEAALDRALELFGVEG